MGIKLQELFECVDKDKSGKLTQTEFDQLVRDPAFLLEFKEATEMEKETLSQLFEALADHPDPEHPDDVPQISQDTFIQGLRDEKNQVTERSVMRLEKRLRLMESVAISIEAQLVG